MARHRGRALRNCLHLMKLSASGKQAVHGLFPGIAHGSVNFYGEGAGDCRADNLTGSRLKPTCTDVFATSYGIGQKVKGSAAVQAEERNVRGAEEHEFRAIRGAFEEGEKGTTSEGGAEIGGRGFQPWQGARVPLNVWQQAAVAAGAAVGAALNPARADLVAALGETTGSLAFRRILARMRRSEERQKFLLERPRVMSKSMARAWDMPNNTFGAAYAKFMGDRNFSPDDRPPVRFMDSEDLAYVATRSREAHDFWHVLFNLQTSVMGELALKMVEFHQTGIPMCFLSVAGASWRLKPKQRNYLFTHYAPWALRAGTSASDLMCIYYEQYLHEDLDERNGGFFLLHHFLKGDQFDGRGRYLKDCSSEMLMEVHIVKVV